MYEKLLIYLEHPELSRFDGIYLFWIFIHVYLLSVRYHSHKREKNMTQKWYHKVLWPFFSWLDAKKPTNPSTILIKNDKVTRRMNIQNRQMVIHTPKQIFLFYCFHIFLKFITSHQFIVSLLSSHFIIIYSSELWHQKLHSESLDDANRRFHLNLWEEFFLYRN